MATKEINGTVNKVQTTDLQSQLADMANRTFVTISVPNGSGSSYGQLTGTLLQFLQAIVNVDPSVYDEFEDIITTP